MDSIFKEITLREAKDLIDKIKDNKEYNTLTKHLEYFVTLKNEDITNEILDELQNFMSRIKRLMELDDKIKDKENMVELFEEISSYFKEQEIREGDLSKIKIGEIFKLVEEVNEITGKKERDLDLFFITRVGANEYKKEHKNEYKGTLKIKVIDNKDKLLEKILRIIEKNY